LVNQLVRSNSGDAQEVRAVTCLPIADSGISEPTLI